MGQCWWLQMNPTNRDVIQHLNEIIEDGVSRYPVPVKKGNSIRIKNVVVRKNKKGYHIFNLADKEYHNYTYSLATALAIAHTIAVDKCSDVEKIEYLDAKLSKYYNDAIFHKYTLEHSDDEIRRDSAEMRYDIALDECRRLKQQIEDYIFDK